MSQTPLVDRLAALPPRVPSRSGQTVLIVVWVSVLLTLAVSVVVGRPPMLRQWLLNDVPEWVERHGIGITLLWTVISSLAMVAVHEGGHALAGMAVRFRFKSIRVGPLQFDRDSGLSFHLGLVNPFSGIATVIPVTTDRLVPRAIAMVAGGPAANILSGCLVLVLPFSPSFPSVLFIVQSIANGLSDLLPYRNKLGVSDGKFLWALLRHPARARRWLALMRLNADSIDGVLPESLPADFLNQAIALRDDSTETVAAHVFAFSNAFHQHRDSEAGRLLETCLNYSSHAPVSMREALMSEAAVFQARRRKRVDLAEQWLEDIPETTQLPWIRLRGQAAILEAKGEVHGALGKLEECEQAVLRWPNPSQRKYLLRLLGRWKSELTTA